MTHDDILKLKAATLYILKQCGETDFIHLFKILYFAERSHYAGYGKHLVKDTFCALERGPVPSFLYDAVKVATGYASCKPSSQCHLIADALRPSGGECRYYMLSAAEEPDMDELSPAEIASLDAAIAEHRYKGIGQLSTESHDLAWTSAWNSHHASAIDSALIAKAGGASDDFIAYIKEQEELDRLLTD